MYHSDENCGCDLLCHVAVQDSRSDLLLFCMVLEEPAAFVFCTLEIRQYVFPKQLESRTNLHGVVMYMTSNIVILVSNEVSMKFVKLCFSLLNIHPIVLIISPCM